MKAVDVATSKVKKWQPEAHAAAINALLPVADNLVASGDDEGCIKLWDPRQPSEASASFSEHTDFIADFAYQVCSHSASLHLCIAHISAQQAHCMAASGQKACDPQGTVGLHQEFCDPG